MALAGVKLDDGRGGFAANCFPVRPAFGRTNEDASGAWLIAQHAEQRRRFKAVLCSKPRTYSRIKEERKKSELQGTRLDSHKFDDEPDHDDDGDGEDKVLDGFFLMKHCCIDDPADLCSVNIAGKELNDVKEDDLPLFENVAYINAGENYLPFEAFRGFPALRELEIPLNGLRGLHIEHTDFSNLEMLDLSYNNLSQDDLLTLGLLTHLKVLHLTGNNFHHLPQDMAMPYLSREKQVRLQRYSCLEVLLLDDNQLSDMAVFAALAGLPKLRHLNMSKNEIFFVPQLKSVEGRVVTQDGKEKKRSHRPSSSRKSGRRSKSRATAKEASLVDLEATGIAPENLRSKETTQDASTIVTSVTGERSEVTAPESEPVPEKSGLTEETKDSTLQDLMADDFSTADLSARINDLDLDTGNKPAEMSELPGPKLPPFPELRYLNLSHNKICEEDGLLAVAAWPMLIELDIFKNPLTTECSGDPPLLKRFLQDRLGIKINRLKPEEKSGFLQKTKVEIRPRNRKVTEVVPKVPRLTLEEKMTLALPPPPKAKGTEHGNSPTLRDVHGSKKKSVLPPIPSTPKQELTEAWAEQIEEEEEEEDERFRSREVTREDSDTFFMTQVGDMDERVTSGARPKREKSQTHGSEKSKREKSDGGSPQRSEVDSRYKGYELLLDIEELDNEPELPPAKDIQGNIRALKHALNHQLVYRDPAVELSKVKKMVPEYRRAPVSMAQAHPTYQEQVDRMLTNLKERSIVKEEKLTTVLADKGQIRQQFPEAEDLLAKVQRRYNAVRVHSLKDAREAKQVADKVLNMLPPAPPPKK